MVEMVCCTDSICNDCFRDYFTIKIKETAIQHFTCPICGEPEISYGPLSQEALKYFSSLSGLVSRGSDNNQGNKCLCSWCHHFLGREICRRRSVPVTSEETCRIHYQEYT